MFSVLLVSEPLVFKCIYRIKVTICTVKNHAVYQCQWVMEHVCIQLMVSKKKKDDR